MESLLQRLADEPVALRAAVAACLNYLVVSGVIGAPISEAFETAALALMNLALVASARSRVKPKTDEGGE